jgi:hypothetical protein
MNIEQLNDRMRAFINTDYKAYKFEERSEIIGYALINHFRHPFRTNHPFLLFIKAILFILR